MRLVFRPEAEADLAEIHDHFAQDSPARAQRFIALLRDRCAPLRQFPEMGRMRDDLLPGLRSLPVDRYVVIYRVLGDAVEIVTIVHGSRDVDTLVRGTGA
jgi:toxin ParE1/3/4